MQAEASIVRFAIDEIVISYEPLQCALLESLIERFPHIARPLGGDQRADGALHGFGRRREVALDGGVFAEGQSAAKQPHIGGRDEQSHAYSSSPGSRPRARNDANRSQPQTSTSPRRGPLSASESGARRFLSSLA